MGIKLEKQIQYDLYFLLDIDVKWIEDGLRDLGDKREVMFEKFKHELDKRMIAYILVSGTYEHREQFIIKKLDEFF